MKILEILKKHKSRNIQTEGVFYDFQTDEYVAEHYFKSENKEIGRYRTLKEAIVAKETYEKAIKTIKN